MTDKQIIIDGVPVQDCCYFDYENDGYKDSCYIHQNECSAQNCYYKQLKRKEQECEELKEKVKEYGEINEQETKDYAELKAENDELKEEKQGLIKDWEEKKNLAYEIACKNEKLKQTLTEIKEIIQNQGHIDILEERILQKISECEGNDENL